MHNIVTYNIQKRHRAHAYSQPTLIYIYIYIYIIYLCKQGEETRKGDISQFIHTHKTHELFGDSNPRIIWLTHTRPLAALALYRYTGCIGEIYIPI